MTIAAIATFAGAVGLATYAIAATVGPNIGKIIGALFRH